jgi:hypothetical protein
MTKDRLIWRPNELSTEDWEAMSRAEQINWWKARTERVPPKRRMSEAIRLYQEGNITSGEFATLSMRLAALDELDEFVRACPPELLMTLRDSLAAYGDDEAAWPRTFFMGSHFPWVGAEEIEDSNRREQEQIWRGVRLLKEFFRAWGR